MQKLVNNYQNGLIAVMPIKIFFSKYANDVIIFAFSE